MSSLLLVLVRLAIPTEQALYIVIDTVKYPLHVPQLKESRDTAHYELIANVVLEPPPHLPTMSDPTTASTTLSSPTWVQPEDTPSHIATLSTAELDAECIEVDHYLTTFSHLARAAPEPLRPIAEQAWFNMNAMFTMYLRELEGRGRRDDAADGVLAQRSPGCSMDNGQFPRPPGVRYGPRERPRKSGPCKNLKGQGQSSLQGVVDSQLTIADSFLREGQRAEQVRNHSTARFHGGIHRRVVWQQHERKYDRGTCCSSY